MIRISAAVMLLALAGCQVLPIDLGDTNTLPDVQAVQDLCQPLRKLPMSERLSVAQSLKEDKKAHPASPLSEWVKDGLSLRAKVRKVCELPR